MKWSTEVDSPAHSGPHPHFLTPSLGFPVVQEHSLPLGGSPDQAPLCCSREPPPERKPHSGARPAHKCLLAPHSCCASGPRDPPGEGGGFQEVTLTPIQLPHLKVKNEFFLLWFIGSLGLGFAICAMGTRRWKKVRSTDASLLCVVFSPWAGGEQRSLYLGA